MKFNSSRCCKSFCFSNFLFFGQSLLNFKLFISCLSSQPFGFDSCFILSASSLPSNSILQEFLFSYPVLFCSSKPILFILILSSNFFCLFKSQVLPFSLDPLKLMNPGEFKLPLDRDSSRCFDFCFEPEIRIFSTFGKLT